MSFLFNSWRSTECAAKAGVPFITAPVSTGQSLVSVSSGFELGEAGAGCSRQVPPVATHWIRWRNQVHPKPVAPNDKQACLIQLRRSSSNAMIDIGAEFRCPVQKYRVRGSFKSEDQVLNHSYCLVLSWFVFDSLSTYRK